jgi:hypothetical protein
LRRKTKADELRFRYLSDIGCILCGRPSEVHHITGAGMGMKSSHSDTIPLCHEHHRTGGCGTAVHAGTKTWEGKFGSQYELLEKTNKKIAELRSLHG